MAQIYAVARQETYDYTYFIKANSFDEAVEALDAAFEVGSVLCPGMEINAKSFNEQSRDVTDYFDMDYMEKNLDVDCTKED